MVMYSDNDDDDEAPPTTRGRLSWIIYNNKTDFDFYWMFPIHNSTMSYSRYLTNLDAKPYIPTTTPTMDRFLGKSSRKRTTIIIIA